jgi:hypothetical protein
VQKKYESLRIEKVVNLTVDMLPAAHIQRARVHSVRTSKNDELEINILGDKNENHKKTLAKVYFLES